MTAQPARSRSAIDVPRQVRISVLSPSSTLNGNVLALDTQCEIQRLWPCVCVVRHFVRNKVHVSRYHGPSVLSCSRAVHTPSRVAQKSVYWTSSRKARAGWEAKPVYGFINQDKRHPGNKPGINQSINQLILCINWLCQDSGLRDKLANWSFASHPVKEGIR